LDGGRRAEGTGAGRGRLLPPELDRSRERALALVLAEAAIGVEAEDGARRDVGIDPDPLLRMRM
jgi:hypothetical protein